MWPCFADRECKLAIGKFLASFPLCSPQRRFGNANEKLLVNVNCFSGKGYNLRYIACSQVSIVDEEDEGEGESQTCLKFDSVISSGREFTDSLRGRYNYTLTTVQWLLLYTMTKRRFLLFTFIFPSLLWNRKDASCPRTLSLLSTLFPFFHFQLLYPPF